MESLWFHPKIVHVPIALGILMPLVAGGLAVAWWRSWLPARVWIVAVGLQAVLLGSGVVALTTGEAEEDRVEQVVPEQVIEEHEHAATSFVWASAAVLVVMAAGLIAARRRRTALALAALATAGTLVVLGLGYRTGQAGGALVYEHGAASAYVGAGRAPPVRPIQAASDDEDH